ncbi:protein-glutamate methylesterase/protein-glutamine glutaminase [Micavibrio aeruginosavorus]|uniref:Protein-glutamate methylesterase/protein-glutamine glutaminase n=1 Tax=Micavibrio aeruginosavorus EPB TaxID=349215 RepID=M4VVQ2_9BACT|nr:chemotaxis response regulator protein-glutamate methylesterase [Micavibrio aeruginosavorus]AGH97279.1 Chemotaxis response regulator protein-glutamate methylesterase CheB [Micavibrio aeruginosavorus EPB]
MDVSPVRVMLVDDSVVVRGLLRNIIEKHDDLDIVAAAADGQTALRDYRAHRPDIVLMDVEMPHMDGLSALREILVHDPEARVIMCSSLTQAGAETTYQALHIGAVDCLAKPSSKSIDRGLTFEQELLLKLRTLGRHGGAKRAPSSPPVSKAPPVLHQHKFGGDVVLRRMPDHLPPNFPLALAIGASTGGPKALVEFLTGVDKNMMLPIFITQHIPPGFSRFLAENIERKTGFPAHEAEEGMLVSPGHVYIAPGQKHMGVHKGIPKRIALTDGPPVNFCKPSVDVMLDSLEHAYGGHLLTVILTGMGADGHMSSRRMVVDGTHNILIAQDEETSVVWGMPGAVAKDGICHAVLPLSRIGAAVNKLVRRESIGDHHAN